MSAEEEKQKELQHLNQETEIIELDQLITEGTDAKIPFTFVYPNTDKKVGVLIRPLSTNEYQNALLKSKKFKSNLLVELAKIGTYKLDESKFPEELLDEMPAGIIILITNEINRISGVDSIEPSQKSPEEIFDELMGF